jgi:hypothetical protein
MQFSVAKLAAFLAAATLAVNGAATATTAGTTPVRLDHCLYRLLLNCGFTVGNQGENQWRARTC